MFAICKKKICYGIEILIYFIAWWDQNTFVWWKCFHHETKFAVKTVKQGGQNIMIHIFLSDFYYFNIGSCSFFLTVSLLLLDLVTTL